MQTDACFPLSPFLEANRREGGNTHEQDDRAAQQMLHVHRRAVYAILAPLYESLKSFVEKYQQSNSCSMHAQ